MGLRRCDKCDEEVDEAKAFCPGCGNAFVEEEKPVESSKYEQLGSTVQLGQTMYNQMLSEMGLNIGKPAPTPPEKRVEVIAPVQTAAAASVPSEQPPRPETAAGQSGPGKLFWIAVGLIGAFVLLPIALVSAVLLLRDIAARLT